ncbi:serine hydrolase domain-containing protein [Pseudolysinimonas kribbensis]|uniref:serine hydrolase domain-containing protein n=1 Tax=Pseudolysinimonas kribbensis TaxID=433641 RepID=UPI0031CE76C1
MTRREGHVAEGFEPVARAFEASFEGRPGMGAALAVLHRGELVVDLHGGSADRHGRTPWTDRTLSVIFSCTKGVLSILVARLVQEGRLDYDAPAIRYWPEFGEAGKSDLTVGDLLAHRAGLSAPRQDLSVDDIVDWDRMVSILARQEPLWAPGTGWAYHAITHGWLGGELVRRVTGRSVGDRFREAVAEPLGVDMWIGLPADRHDRVATMWSGPSLDELTATQQRERGFPGHEWLWRAMTLGGALPPELVGDGVGFNDPRIHSAEIPGAGGIADARALATVWSATVTPTHGVRLLDDATLDIALVPRATGAPVFDAAPPWPRWGAGFQLDSEARRYLSDASFGHDGAGGQVAFADREHEIGFAFLTNQMEADDDRGTRIVDALRECVTR